MVYRLSGIETRYTCVPEYARASDIPVYEPEKWPLSYLSTTRERNEHYRDSVIPIADRAARQAIELASAEASEITHVVVVSCTGFFAPGLDIHLVKALGMRPDTQRTVIGFMGCYAAFNALRLADAFCKSQPDARVLIVCAELCTLHFQIDNSLDSLVVNSLFADGVAALVVSRRNAEAPEAAGRLAYLNARAEIDDDSMGHMSWSIGDTGFMMGLSSKVPDVVARQVPQYVENLLAPAFAQRSEIGFWAIHPGGKQIIDKAQVALGLTDGDVLASLETLRDYGNMSSPTILFVLKRLLDTGGAAPGALGAAMAFGPGLTIEGCLLRRMPV
jgi:alpha-pyrone synthase